MMNNKFVVHR